MPTVTPTNATLPQNQSLDDILAFLDRQKNGITSAPVLKMPVKIPYAGKENPAETRELKAAAEPPKNTKGLVDSAVDSARAMRKAATGALVPGPQFAAGSAAALRKAIKASAVAPKAPKGAPKVAKAAKQAAKPTPKPKGAKTKIEIISALLQRKSGTTTAEILDATSWPSVSVPQQAKAAGLKLRKEKITGKPTRYFGSK